MKRKRSRNGKSRGMFGISAVVLVLFGVLNVRSRMLEQKNIDYQEELSKLEWQIEAEEARTEEIEQMKEYIQSDEYAEQVAKDKLGLVYEDEIVFRPE